MQSNRIFFAGAFKKVYNSIVHSLQRLVLVKLKLGRFKRSGKTHLATSALDKEMWIKKNDTGDLEAFCLCFFSEALILRRVACF